MQVYVLDEERTTLLSNNEFCLPVGRFFFEKKNTRLSHKRKSEDGSYEKENDRIKFSLSF